MSRPAVTTAVDAVAQDLRAAVLAGDPAPGERLREEALSTTYQVARHTVRAALRALAAERLVVIEPHRGARVAHLGSAELLALFELRTALEVEAARLAAARCGAGSAVREPAVLAAAELLDRLCRADPPDRAAVDAAHLALHHALVAGAGSPRITQAHAALAVEQRLALLQSRAALPVEQMARHHHDLLRDLVTRGPEALRDHLGEGRVLTVPAVPAATPSATDRQACTPAAPARDTMSSCASPRRPTTPSERPQNWPPPDSSPVPGRG